MIKKDQIYFFIFARTLIKVSFSSFSRSFSHCSWYNVLKISELLAKPWEGNFYLSWQHFRVRKDLEIRPVNKYVHSSIVTFTLNCRWVSSSFCITISFSIFSFSEAAAWLTAWMWFEIQLSVKLRSFNLNSHGLQLALYRF